MSVRLRQIGISLQKVVWTKRAQSWEDTPNPGLDRVCREIIDRATQRSFHDAVDLGCGSGQLAIPLAQFADKVLAVDIAPTMLEILQRKALAAGVSNISVLDSSLEKLELPENSLDLVVSNYVLHHLGDEDKARVVAMSYRWLRPGGQLIIGDMMFGRGSSAQDRQIIKDKVLKLAKLGIGGWWRIAKNAARFTFRIQEKPVSVETWRRYLTDAGFDTITFEPVVAEATIAVATKAPK